MFDQEDGYSTAKSNERMVEISANENFREIPAMSKPRILAFAGSARRDSFNKKLVRAAGHGAKANGAEVSFVDLRDFPLPLFDQDLEADDGEPENAKRLKQLFLDHQGLLIASPEYNSSLSPLLKNTLDWVSRSETPLAAFQGKTAAIMSASPGGLGGLRGLVHLRAILGNIGVLVLPEQHAVSQAHEAFDDEGNLQDDRQRSKIEGLGASLANAISKLQG